MVYLTDLADFMGNTFEELLQFIVNFTPGLMLFIGLLSFISIIVYFFMWMKQHVREVNT